MKLRLLSDIHLELFKDPRKYIDQLINPRGDVLLLAGDIGNPTSNIYKSFITEVAKYYNKVFIITGNHEYYQRYNRTNHEIYPKGERTFRYSMEDIDKITRCVTDDLPNVHFLQRDSFIYNRVRFLGCTLWSMADPNLTQYMNDYEMIQNMTANKSIELYEQNRKWLDEELALKSIDYDYTVVMTHHLPSYKLVSEKYINHRLNCFFANNLDNLVEKADIWVCGHSHIAKTITIGKCRCYLNPVGYSNEYSGYDTECMIEVMLSDKTNQEQNK